jgi:signal transduction histidine kinase
MHGLVGMLFIGGPLLWGLIVLAFSGFLPLLTRFSASESLGRRYSLAAGLYFWAMIHMAIVMRNYDFVVPSVLPDHGLTDFIRDVLNVMFLNLATFTAWHFSAGIIKDYESETRYRLFASISHDMKTPCHAMSLLITLITDNMNAGDADGVTLSEADTRNLLDGQKKDMRQLSGLVDTLLTLVGNFLLYSTLHQNPDAVLLSNAEPIDFKLCDLLEEVSFVGAPLADQKQLDFTTQCDNLASDVLLGPVADLKRILGNLVSNAINYTTSGRVTLSTKRIDTDTVATTPANPDVVRVKFEVQDTGAGIAKSKQSRLWQPYVRGGTTPNFVPSPSLPLLSECRILM